MDTSQTKAEIETIKKLISSRANAKVRWDQARVLIVEDEPDLREILMMVFEQEGTQVMAARDGIEALEILKSYHPDFIISDVRMPNCDGIKLLEKLRQKHPAEPPVFLATGFADLNEAEAIQKGAVSLIAKPFNINELFSILEQKLRSHEPFKKWL